MSMKKKSPGQGNRVKRGTISVVYTIVFIALVIALNLIVSSVAGSVNLNIDLTAEEFISIGQVSHNVLDALDRDGELQATIYLLADRDSYDSTDNTANGLNLPALVRDLCEEYAYTFDSVNVEYKNLNRDPQWATKYNEITNTVLSASHIVIEGKYHARVLTLDSFFTVDSESRTYVGFNGEVRLTTALLQSCISEPQVVTFTTGHGEPAQLVGTGKPAETSKPGSPAEVSKPAESSEPEELSEPEESSKPEESTESSVPAESSEPEGSNEPMESKRVNTALALLLRNAGFELVETDLSREEIDPRTKILIINDPVSDFTDSEVEKLMDYTAGYNSLIVLVDDSTPELPNLSDYLLEEWGMGYRPYHQLTSSANFNNNPLLLSAQMVTEYEDPEASAAYHIVRNLISDGARQRRVVMPHSVELYSAPVGTKDDYTVETVLRSASATSTHEGTEQTGEYPLMLLSANSEYVDLEDENSTNQVLKSQYVMLVGSTDFAGTGSIDSALYANGNLMLSAARTMGMERYSLNIPYKEINDVALGIETASAFRLGVLICAVFPAAIVVVGLVVFVRRRHL